jgi:hypothetical protein
MTSVIGIKEFRGLDLRNSDQSAEPSSFFVLSNLQGTAGREVKTAPGSKTIAKLDRSSVGLFSIDGNLRSVAPAGYADIAANQPLNVRYIYVGNGGLYPRDQLVSLRSVQSYGSDTTGIALPYMAIEEVDGRIYHHYGDDEPEKATDTVQTRVALPFEPGGSVLNLAGRLWDFDNLTGSVNFSSIVNGARDWTAEGDAGNFPASSNAPGDRTMIALSHFRQRLVVAFEDSMQLWGVDTNPDNISIARSVEEQLNGPGTTAPRALENVLGDTFYLSRGGMRRLSTSTVEGERRDDQGVGVKVDDRIQELRASFGDPISLWSQARGQLLVAFGDVVLCLTYVPRGVDGDSVIEWAEWNLPFSITDMVEAGGRLYVRDTDHLVRELSDDYDSHDTEKIKWALRTPFIGDDEKARLWQFMDLRFDATGDFTIYGHPNILTPEVREQLGRQSGPSNPFDRIFTPYTTQSLAIGLEGEGRFTLDAYSLRLNQLAV